MAKQVEKRKFCVFLVRKEAYVSNEDQKCFEFSAIQISVLNLQLTFDLSFKVLPKLCNMLIMTLLTELKVKSSKHTFSIYNKFTKNTMY